MSLQPSDFNKDLSDAWDALRLAINDRPKSDPLWSFLDRLEHGSVFARRHFANSEYEQLLLNALTAMEHL